MEILINRRDVDVLSTQRDLFYADTFQFSYNKHGFNVAAAFTAYDSNPEWILDKKYGEIFFNHFSWGYDKEKEAYFTVRQRLTDRICSREDLGLEGDPANHFFYPLHAASAGIVSFYQKKFLCLEPDDLFIYGDYNTAEARQFNVQLKRCRGEGCATDEETTAFFRNKFILLIFNQVRFDSTLYGYNSIIPETRSIWLPINTQAQQTVPFKVATTHSYLQDMFVNLDSLTEIEDERVFRFNLEPFKSYEKDYDVQVDITIEMDLNLTVVARDIYTGLDWISDIGGIQGMLISFVAVFMMYWNYNQLSNYLVTRLYKMKKPDARKRVYLNPDDSAEFIFPRILSNPRDAFCDLLPSCLQCCRSNRRDASLQIGRDKLDKEINIIEIIKSRRYFKASLKLLLTKKQRERLQRKTQYIHVDPEGSDESGSCTETDFDTDELRSDPEERFFGEPEEFEHDVSAMHMLQKGKKTAMVSHDEIELKEQPLKNKKGAGVNDLKKPIDVQKAASKKSNRSNQKLNKSPN